MKTSYKIIIGVGAVVLLYVLWELYCAWQDGKTDEPDTGDSATPDTANATTAANKTTVSTAAKVTNSNPIVVRYGSKNTYVRNIQQWLNHYLKAGLTTDGSYGPKTNEALQNFEKIAFMNGFAVDNIMTNDGNHYTITKEQYNNIANNIPKINQKTATTVADAYQSPTGGGFFRPGMI